LRRGRLGCAGKETECEEGKEGCFHDSVDSKRSPGCQAEAGWRWKSQIAFRQVKVKLCRTRKGAA
jgi:hypothetical protein